MKTLQWEGRHVIIKIRFVPRDASSTLHRGGKTALQDLDSVHLSIE